MPFRPARSARRTLSLVLLAAALAGGCALRGAPAPGAKAGEAAAPAAPAHVADGGLLSYYDTITGGREGTALTGVAEVRLRRPVAVAVRDQDIYIADADAERVYHYDPFTRQLDLVVDLHGQIGGDPAALYVAADRSIWLTDTFGARVLHFSRKGKLVQVLENALNLARPVGVSVNDANGDVYVADGLMDQVLVFNREGKLWRSIAGRGTNPGELLNTTAMARDSDGIYLTARLGVRGQVLNEGGEPLHVFESGTLVFPTGVAVDAERRVYVSDSFDNTIKIYQDGKLIARQGMTGVAPGRYKGLAGLCVSGPMLYVADSLNSRVQIMRIGAP